MLSSDAAWSFSPYVSWRRGTLLFAALRPLVPAETWGYLEQAQAVHSERVRLAGELLPWLHAEVPKAADLRAPLIRLQRDLHNDRPPTAATLVALRGRLSMALDGTIEAWLLRFERENELARRAGAALQTERRAAEHVLSALAANENIALGIQLSARSLGEGIRLLVAAPTDPDDRRVRRARQTLVSLLFRTALKPSPFGTFTEIGAHPWSMEPASESSVRRRDVRLSRMLLDWMEYELCGLEECRGQVTVRLNNTLRRHETHVDFLSRGANGSPHMFGAERFVRIPLTEPLRAVLDTAPDAASIADLAVALGGLGIPDDQLRTYLERLVAVGLLERSLGLPDQAPDHAAAMSEALARVPGERAARGAAVLVAMSRIEAAMAETGPASRVPLMAELSREVAHFAELMERPVPDDSGAPHFYENAFATGIGASWDGPALQREAPRLGLVTQVLRLFDVSVIERLGLYRLFVEASGPDGVMDLLDFYHRFARLGASAVSDLMRGAQDADVEQVRGLSRAFLDHLATHDARAETLHLDEEWLGRFVARFPPWLAPLPSTSIRLQRFSEPGAATGWVVNGIGPGQGARFSRFCEVEQKAGWSLREAVAQQIARRWPWQTDLAAVLGVNTNLHPSLCPTELEYPRSRANPEARRVLRLGDLVIRADVVRRRLMLFEKGGGQPVDLVPMTFLFPAGGPSLYRFLFALGPFVNPPRRFWDNVPVAPSAEGLAVRLPRIQIGAFAMERRSWRIASDIMTPRAGSHGRPGSMMALGQIRAALGLPREGFFRVRPDEAESPDAGWADETRYWAVEARRGRRDKPHYVDFRNPYLTDILLKRLEGGGTLIFQECLPSTAEYGEEGGLASAEEYLVELNREGAP